MAKQHWAKCGVAVLSAVISTAFLLVFSYHTSPLSGSYGYDAAFFQLVGSGLLDGYLPYRDFFDMKGPLLFFIEAFGQLFIRGRSGAFLVQALCLFASIVLVFKIMRLSGEKRWVLRGIAATVAGLFLLSFTLEGGNLTEEISLPLTMAVVYISLKFFTSADKGALVFRPSWAFLCGVLVCAHTMIRVTNAAMVLALLACIATIMLVRGEVRLFGTSLAWMALGFAIPFVAICAFFACNGILEDMLYCVFQFGFSYADEASLVEKIAAFACGQYGPSLLLLATPLAATALCRWRSPWCWMLSLACPALVLLAICMGGNEYLHYVTLAFPIVILALFIALLDFEGSPARSRRCVSLAITAVVLVGSCFPYFHQAAYDSRSHIRAATQTATVDSSYADVLDIADRIPVSDRGSVYCYGDYTWSQWYCIAQLYPCIRYMDWQVHYLQLEPNMRSELIADFEKNPPRWLVLVRGDSTLPDFMKYFIPSEYDEEYRNDSFVLYRLADW